MSWCRWGSPCDFTFPPGLYQVDVDCAKNGCKGSSLYIYEQGDNEFCCCWCILRDDDRDFVGNEDEMLAHIDEHVAAGHHVRQSLRKGADLTVAEKYRGTRWDPSTWEAPGAMTAAERAVADVLTFRRFWGDAWALERVETAALEVAREIERERTEARIRQIREWRLLGFIDEPTEFRLLGIEPPPFYDNSSG